MEFFIPEKKLLVAFLVCVLLILLYPITVVVVKFLNKLWWSPIRVQRFMQAQGIRGPSYRFIHGSTKEIFNMRKESMSQHSLEISHHTFSRIQPYIYSWIKTYGRNYLQWIGPQATLVVTESEMIKEVLSNRDGRYPKGSFSEYTRKLLGDGIVTTASVEKWAKLRKVSNHAFHGESLKGMVPEMIESVEVMLERWKDYDGKEIDVYNEFRLLSSEVISRTAFGSSYLEGENIFELLMKLTQIVAKNAFKLRIPIIRKLLKDKDEVESEKLVTGIREAMVRMIKIRERKVIIGEAESFGDDFLGSLINAHHEPDESKRLSLDDMIDECKSFYVAGKETTNSLLAWLMLLLAIHTEWQEEARREVLQIFGQNKPHLDGISKLKTISMIIHETLRLYSPVIGLVRNVEKEVKVGELTLPANMNVFISTLALHYNAEIWGEDVHLFKPERFSEGIAKATKNNLTVYIPFGMGPRNCVGFNYAAIEAKIAVSMILQRYRFTLSPAYVHSPMQVITVRPQHGVQVILHAV